MRSLGLVLLLFAFKTYADSGCSRNLEDWIVTPADELMFRGQSGDEEALEELFQKMHPYLSHIALKQMRNVHDAEDLAQQTVLLMLEKRAQFKLSVYGWARTISHHAGVSNRMRDNRRRFPHVSTEVAAPIAAEEPTPALIVAENDQAEIVRQVVRGLPPMYREVVELFYFQGIAAKDCAERLGVPVGTAKRRLFYARKQILESLAGLITAEDFEP